MLVFSLGKRSKLKSTFNIISFYQNAITTRYVGGENGRRCDKDDCRFYHSIDFGDAKRIKYVDWRIRMRANSTKLEHFSIGKAVALPLHYIASSSSYLLLRKSQLWNEFIWICGYMPRCAHLWGVHNSTHKSKSINLKWNCTHRKRTNKQRKTKWRCSATASAGTIATYDWICNGGRMVLVNALTLNFCHRHRHRYRNHRPLPERILLLFICSVLLFKSLVHFN